ncbi:ImmA/IrrE family metallo-endopeptidase [Acetobacter fabarum]|uniref:ImmA/IrrE family metallo-endopeptidase n=1 Tax=Acetobacter fabarum TaxID=483199 RepID=UPI0039EB5697
MSIQRARYTKIRHLTISLLDRFNVKVAPVPIQDLLFASGIDIKFGDLGEVSGLIARQGRHTIVGVNSIQAHTRQRFTLAHEFGHFLLHHDLQSHTDVGFRVNYRDRKSSEATDIEEIEANFFAASILMPRPFLDRMNAFEALTDDDQVNRLAEIFDVSVHAMSLRLANEYSCQRSF